MSFVDFITTSHNVEKTLRVLEADTPSNLSNFARVLENTARTLSVLGNAPEKSTSKAKFYVPVQVLELA